MRALVGGELLLLVLASALATTSPATLAAGRTENGTGLMINSSRAVLYVRGEGEDFAEAARRVAGGDVRDDQCVPLIESDRSRRQLTGGRCVNAGRCFAPITRRTK